MTGTILITGSSSGIGRATARHFHEQGWNVIATMRNPERETELTALDNVLVTRLDVQDSPRSPRPWRPDWSGSAGSTSCSTTPGYGAYGLLEATPTEKIRRQFDVNVLGLLETTKAVLPHLRANGGGTVVSISSIGGKVTFPLGTLYHGTKFAVEGLSEALHYELAGDRREGQDRRAGLRQHRLRRTLLRLHQRRDASPSTRSSSARSSPPRAR